MMRSLRWRLVASYILLTLLTVTMTGFLALSLVGRYVAQQEARYLAANAEGIAHRVRPLLRPAPHPLALHDLAHTASFLGNARVRILDAQEQPLADSGPGRVTEDFLWIASASGMTVPTDGEERGGLMLSLSPLDHRPAEEPAFLGTLPADAEITFVRRVEGAWGSQFIFEEIHAGSPLDAPSQQEVLVAAEVPRSPQVVRVPVEEGGLVMGYVELSGTPDLSAEAVATTRRAFGTAAAGATLLALLVGLVASQRVTASLHALALVARRMGEGDLAARAQVVGQDESAQLALQFNRMAERLESSFAALAAERDTLRRFVADASHELRTPITAMRTFNELLQGGAGEKADARAEFLAESAVQLRRLEWITHHLLDLARLDGGLVALELEPDEVDLLIERVLRPFLPQAQTHGVELVAATPLPHAEVIWDAARVEGALANLLDNALKFTPLGGKIEVGAERREAMIELWVRDDGPGIALDEQPRLFERFYRGQDSRAEGSGLGLAIVLSVAQAHGGDARVESEPGHGSRFVIELPVSLPAGGAGHGPAV
ncbi:MAG: HAMP domain-containing histidine kinase [Ardenticatenales bacterium]|nr:HAMP domain-containing histidine kinase [Ardenticatenales bacterium]